MQIYLTFNTATMYIYHNKLFFYVKFSQSRFVHDEVQWKHHYKYNKTHHITKNAIAQMYGLTYDDE